MTDASARNASGLMRRWTEPLWSGRRLTTPPHHCELAVHPFDPVLCCSEGQSISERLASGIPDTDRQHLGRPHAECGVLGGEDFKKRLCFFGRDDVVALANKWRGCSVYCEFARVPAGQAYLEERVFALHLQYSAPANDTPRRGADAERRSKDALHQEHSRC